MPSKEGFATAIASQRGKGRMQWVFTCTLASCLNRYKNSCQKLLFLHISQLWVHTTVSEDQP